ncbi:MAG: FHA domain-containing protein [Planctomycetota bacterium]|nr:FHA domain-containing protein [Planctomycetota bacterium]
MIPSRNGGLVATKDLSVPEVARRLRIKVDEVFLLILAGVLKAQSRGADSFKIREETLEEFAVLVALNLEDNQSFEAGLVLFIHSIRDALSCSQTELPELGQEQIEFLTPEELKHFKFLTNKRPLGELLISRDVVSQSDLEIALREQELGKELGRRHRRLGEIFVDNKCCGVEDIAKALARQVGRRYCDLTKLEIDPAVIERIPKNIAWPHSVIPISEQRGCMTVAICDVENGLMMVDDLAFMLNCDVKIVIASDSAIEAAITKYYGPAEDESQNDALSELGGSWEAIPISKEEEAMHKRLLEQQRAPAKIPKLPPPPLPPTPAVFAIGENTGRGISPVEQELNPEDLDDLKRDLSEHWDLSTRASGLRVDPLEMGKTEEEPEEAYGGGYVESYEQEKEARSRQTSDSKYTGFDGAMSDLEIDELELKKLVSQGELRGFRDGRSMKFKRDDLLNLKQGRETEPTVILTDSDQAMRIAESSDELILEDSTSDTVINIGDIMLGRRSEQQEIVFDTREEFEDDGESDCEGGIPDVDVPSIAKDIGFDDDDARLLDVGADAFSSSGFRSDSASETPSSSSSRMETEAFELMEESGQTDGFVAEVRTSSRRSKERSKREETGFFQSLKKTSAEEKPMDGLFAMELPETISQQHSESIIHRITPKKIMPAQDAPSTGAAFGRRSSAKLSLSLEKNEVNRRQSTSFKGKADKKSKRHDHAPSKPKPMRSPAPEMSKLTRAGSAAPRTKQIEIETVERRTTVRHHKQMYLQKSYPLFVIISQHKIKKLISVLVDQVSSKKAFNIKKSNPNVHIRPIFPGCLCVPNELDLDVTERVAEAQFWLTPQALGKLEGAKVEILYEGKVVDTIDIDCTATTQALAKLSGSAAFITTSFGPTFESLGKSLSEKGAGWIGELLQMAGSENGPLITSAMLGVLTVLFYLWKKPREADPIQNMFDYEMDSAPRGNPHVMKQKCRLVLLSRAGRQKFELVEEKTTMGRTADCLVTLKERSVAPKHAEIHFDPDLQEFSVRPLDGSVKVNGIDVGKLQKLPRDAVIEFGGDVSFWFYDEREDASGWDRAHIRAKIEQKLIETLGSFTREIQAAFRDPKNKTVRGALAVLMVKGVLTPGRWSLIKKASNGFRS